MKISAVTIAQNEEGCIGDCISSVKDYVDEHVVVDGGSTDNTVNIAKSLGAIVYHNDFTMASHKKNFANQKNFGIVKATYDWILIIDSDEMLEASLLSKFSVLIDDMPHPHKQMPIQCFLFPRKNYYNDDPDDKDPATMFNWPDYQRMLFRNYCRFEGRIHEQLTGFACEARTPISAGSILHRKSTKRQQQQDDLYFELRPTDYRDRLGNDAVMLQRIKEGVYKHDPRVERLARDWFPHAFD